MLLRFSTKLTIKATGRQPLSPARLSKEPFRLQSRPNGTSPRNTVRDRIFTGNGPLATFSGKIEVGFAMGIYGPRARRDRHRIRKIRNRFAHELNPITFDMPEMKELCESIELTQRTPIPDLSVRKITPQRYKYERACKSFVFVFGVRADELQKSWPDKSAPRPPLPTLS